MKRFIYFIALSMLMASCSSDEPTKNSEFSPIELSRNEQGVVDSQLDFAVGIFKNTVLDDLRHNASNTLVSPLSLSMNLSMLGNGAEGETLTEIVNALGVDNAVIGDMNSLNRILSERLPGLDSKTTLSMANSVWIDEGFDVRPEFLGVCRDYYAAESFSADLQSLSFVDAINAWSKQKTNGLIERVITTPSDDAMRLTIGNALYFKGVWCERFDKSKTSEAEFANIDGTRKHVPMMTQDVNVAVTESGNATVVRKEYGNGAFAMNLVLPYEEIPMEEFVAALSADRVAGWQRELARTVNVAAVELYLPRFECEAVNGLSSPLSAMGVQRLFSQNAELSGISATPTAIDDIVQSVKLKVDEEGAKAAAVTLDVMLGANPGSTGSTLGKIKVEFNRPFMYYISEQSTGAILFAGVVTNL